MVQDVPNVQQWLQITRDINNIENKKTKKKQKTP